MSYGKAWYVNPELWGLDSSQVESVILDQEDDNAAGNLNFEKDSGTRIPPRLLRMSPCLLD